VYLNLITLHFWLVVWWHIVMFQHWGLHWVLAQCVTVLPQRASWMCSYCIAFSTPNDGICCDIWWLKQCPPLFCGTGTLYISCDQVTRDLLTPTEAEVCCFIPVFCDFVSVSFCCLGICLIWFVDALGYYFASCPIKEQRLSLTSSMTLQCLTTLAQTT